MPRSFKDPRAARRRAARETAQLLAVYCEPVSGSHEPVIAPAVDALAPMSAEPAPVNAYEVYWECTEMSAF